MADHSSDDGVVTVKSDPIDQGWIPLGKRKWQMPDGRIYEFAPNVEEKVIVFVGPWKKS